VTVTQVYPIIDVEKNKASDNARKSMKNCFLGFVDFEKAKPDKRLIDGFKREAGKL